MIQDILFNPFKKLAGGKALAIGLAILLLTAFIASFSRCHFDGVLDAHVGAEMPVFVYYLEPLIAWGLTALIFFITGSIFSTSKVRFIDVLGTTVLARYPCIFVAVLAFSLPDIQINTLMNVENISIGELNTLLLVIILMLVFSIWSITLLYHAFSVSCNLKKNKGIWAFTGAIILAEIISKILFYYLYLNF